MSDDKPKDELDIAIEKAHKEYLELRAINETLRISLSNSLEREIRWGERLVDTRDKLKIATDAIEHIMGQPFNGSWDAQALYCGKKLNEIKTFKGLTK